MTTTPERIEVRVVPVTVVAEPATPACGCANPNLHWSPVYAWGRASRRLYFFCSRCETFGFIALPEITWGEASILDGMSKADLQRRAEGAVAVLPEISEVAAIYRRAAEDVFTRRARCAEFHPETIGRAIIDHALAQFTARATEILAEREAQLANERLRVAEVRARLEDELQRARRGRKRAVDRSLSRRKPVGRSAFPIVARGEHHSGAVIYGLVDPRQPDRIRYVGQAKSAGSRLASHISGCARPTSKKDRWIAQLVGDDAYPDMVLLERAKPDADVDALERWWIAQMVAKGQADLNTALVPKRIADAGAEESPV